GGSCRGSRACRSAFRWSWNSSSRWRRDAGRREHGTCGFHHAGPASDAAHDRKGTARGTPHLLSNDARRRALDFLPGGGPEGRTDAAAAPRPAVLVTHVRAAVRTAVGSLSPRRTGLPWIRAQRLAGSEDARVHVRSLRGD